jgi:copper transport protein
MTSFGASDIGRRLGAALLVVIGAAVLWTAMASAHAMLESSDPAANAVVQTAPSEVTMHFTESLQRGSSKAELFDAHAMKIDTAPSRIGSDSKELILTLPANLAQGTYTVQWQDISAEDGHPDSGYFAFTVGSQANVALTTPPPSPSNGSSVISLAGFGRWLGFLGLAALVGSIFAWLWVIVPATSIHDSPKKLSIARRTGFVGSVLTWRWRVRPAAALLRPDQKQEMARNVRLAALVGVAGVLCGSLLLALSQLQASGSTGTSAAWNVVIASRFGLLLIARDLLAVALGAVVWRMDAWTNPASRLRWVALLLAVALPIPFALTSHASAQPSGRPTAIVADWLHLTAVSLWIGGLLTIVVGVVAVRSLDKDQRRDVYSDAITGFYAAWLQVGNLTSLKHTTYGHTLVIKLLALLPLLLLGAFNLMIVGPRMRRRRSTAQVFSFMVASEVLLGILILAISSVLAGLPTAREVTTFSSGHPAFQFDQNGVRAALQISPGTVGTNQFTADVEAHDSPLPADAQVLLRVRSNGQVTGEQEIPLVRQPGSNIRYMASGSELSLAGEWQVDLIVRLPNQSDWDVATPIHIDQMPMAERAPGPPPRFIGILPALGLIAAAAGTAVLVIGLRRRRRSGEWWPLNVQAGASTVVVAALLLFLNRSTGLPASGGNPIPRTPNSVAIGHAVYQQHCASCHGPDGRGDGPMAEMLSAPPPDLHAANVDSRSDVQLFAVIRDGIPQSEMPPFREHMSEQDIWNIVNYVRSLRHAP